MRPPTRSAISARAARARPSSSLPGSPRWARTAARFSKTWRTRRALGIRLLGPNSLGFINFVAPTLAWTTPVRRPSRNRGVAIVSQSGATAFFLSNLAHQWDVGLSTVVATGNEADLGCTDFAATLLDDDATAAIALFIETVRDPAGFLAIAHAALARRKPIVVLKTGTGKVSAKSALAHTGALVGDDRVFDGICRQFGLIRVSSIEDLLATRGPRRRAPARSGQAALGSSPTPAASARSPPTRPRRAASSCRRSTPPPRRRSAPRSRASRRSTTRST